MVVPEAYDDYGINNIMIRAASFGASIGITRFFPSIVESSSAIKYGTLSKEEENIYRTVFYRRTLTKSMRNEIKRIKANAAKVKSMGKPEVPMLLFISNGEETSWDKGKWINFQMNYIREMNENMGIQLGGPHYVHDAEPGLIAFEAARFIEHTLNKLLKVH